MRETVIPGTLADNAETPTSLGHLQILTLSHHPARSYVCVSQPSSEHRQRKQAPRAAEFTATTAAASSSVTTGEDEEMKDIEAHDESRTIIVIPAPAHTEELTRLLRTRMGPLWTSRQTLIVGNGAAFEIEDFVVRLGVLRQATGTQATKGVLIEVEWAGDEDEAVGEAVIMKAFEDKLDLSETGVIGRGEGVGLARLYCEVLRLGG